MTRRLQLTVEDTPELRVSVLYSSSSHSESNHGVCEEEGSEERQYDSSRRDSARIDRFREDERLTELSKDSGYLSSLWREVEGKINVVVQARRVKRTSSDSKELTGLFAR